MSFMTTVKTKYILRLAERLKDIDPVLAQDLHLLVAGATNPPHPRPQITLGSLTTAMEKVVEILKNANIPFALAGGLAVKHWVDIRESFDIDFVLHTIDIKKVMTLFPHGNDRPLQYSVKVDNVVIDFIKGDLFPWSDDALFYAQETTDFGIKLKIIKPEYLVLFKLRAGRERDIQDIKGLLSLPITEKVRKLVNEYDSDNLEDIEQMIREVEYGV